MYECYLGYEFGGYGYIVALDYITQLTVFVALTSLHAEGGQHAVHEQAI